MHVSRLRFDLRRDLLTPKLYRTGGPHDEKKDTDREGLLQRVWTGVVPIWETVGEPIAGGAGRVEDVPEHVRAFRNDTNKTNEQYAKTAVLEKT